MSVFQIAGGVALGIIAVPFIIVAALLAVFVLAFVLAEFFIGLVRMISAFVPSAGAPVEPPKVPTGQSSEPWKGEPTKAAADAAWHAEQRQAYARFRADQAATAKAKARRARR